MPGYGIETAITEEMVSWEAVVAKIETSRNYWISTASTQGKPHAAPVWGLWFEGEFYFSTDPTSRKGRNIVANPEVVVHLESGDDVVILEGTLEPVPDRAMLTGRFADAYEAKYHFRVDFANPGFAVYRLRPRVAFAWGEQDFPKSATRWRFQE